MARSYDRRPRPLALSLALFLCVLWGCGSVREPAHEQRARSVEHGPAAARVEGEAISIAEVESMCASSGLSPREALSRLVSERLLARYAEQRGYGALAAVSRGVERAGVQALLAEELEGPSASAETAPRRVALNQLLEKLKRSEPVRFDEAAIQRTFAPSGP